MAIQLVALPAFRADYLDFCEGAGIEPNEREAKIFYAGVDYGKREVARNFYRTLNKVANESGGLRISLD